jgi:hypothetical protein
MKPEIVPLGRHFSMPKYASEKAPTSISCTAMKQIARLGAPRTGLAANAGA